MGRLHAQGHLPFSGSVTVNNDGSVVSFANTGLAGEDFRLPKRTIINHLWHGPPTYNWNPVTHAIVPGTNTHNLNNAQRLAQFFKRPADFPGGKGCAKHGQDPVDIQFDGITWVHGANFLNGAPYSSIHEYTNWTWGSSSPGIVLNGDDEITAKTYRQLELEWDVVEDKPNNEFERYLGSTPKYFHGWFRVFGLLVTTGNFHSPVTFAAPPGGNMKIYKSVSKTYGFQGDTLTYTLSYRNYASVAATGVRITDVLPPELEFVSATGPFSVAGNTVTWNIGTVPGFQSLTGVNPTRGSVKVVCRIRTTALDRFCNKATITCTNGTGWESNEYPNNITATMERNCVDIAQRALAITKTASRVQMNPGDEVNFKLEFENSTNAGWLNGGRPGITVTHAYGYSGPNTANLYFRIFHGAQEAYINYGNYRVSYFVNDPAKSGFFPADPSGWTFQVNILEGGNINKVQYMFQKIPFGEDPINGRKWDQRLVVKFSDTLGALSQHLYKYFGVTGRVHRGAKEPFRTMLKLESNPSNPMSPQLADDWSFDGDASPLNVASNDKDLFFPITPDWTETQLYPAGKPVTKIHVDECRNKLPNFDRILVEEFDGYTWRRAHGRGPLPGRETYDVVVHDTLPIHLDWAGFIDDNALGITATYNPSTRIIEWKIPVMLVGSKGDLSYKAIANGVCPMPEKQFENRAWIWSKTDSKLMSKVDLVVTCDPVPPPPPALTSMTKTANKTTYSPGENIAYTINYTQTHGTIANHSFNNLTNWVAPPGSPGLPVNFTDLTNPWTAPKYFYHNRSHGTDGMLNFSINIANGWPNFSLLFRYQGGQPGAASYNGVALNVWPGKNGINGGVVFSVMNDNTKIVGSDPNTPIPHPFTPGNPVMNFIVVLKGGNMRIWINAADTSSSPPIATYNGLKVQPGYVGFFNGSDASMGGGDNSNQNRPTNWRSHFDSAFDLQISDPLPSNITFTSATNGGSHNAGIVTWPLQPGPILKGTTFSHTINGNISGCALPFITNTAYANMLGQPTNSIGAQSIVGCVSATPVSWIWAKASNAETQTLVEWKVTKTSNDGYFEILASKNGVWELVTIEKAIESKMFYQTQIGQTVGVEVLMIVYHEKGEKSISPLIRLENRTSKVLLSPNPTDSYSNLVLDEFVGAQILIYNSIGQLVEVLDNVNDNVRIGEKLTSGTYHIILQSEKSQNILRWVKN
ncbi:MAG: T9SS type A sorting domain-containing protein [Cytophagales bacterium]